MTREQNEMKAYAEALLGNTVDNSKRAGFIKYDRNVLCFQAVWDDRGSLYGDIQRFEARDEANLFYLRLVVARCAKRITSLSPSIRCYRVK